MGYAAEIATLRAPVVDNWDFSQTPVLWESEGDDVKRLPTGDRSSPGEYMLWRSEYAAGEYLASGDNERHKFIDVDCRLAVSKVAGARAAAIIAARADDLVTYYDNANSGTVNFRTPEAMLTPEYEPNAGWIARDWVCPVWLFSPGPTEQLLAGESANQLTVNQAAHGLSVGDWIGYDGSDWVKADADSQEADGIVSGVTDVDNFTVTSGDIVKISSHGLTQGKLYLSTTAGAATSTAPEAGDPRQYLGKAVDSDYVLVQPGELLDL